MFSAFFLLTALFFAGACSDDAVKPAGVFKQLSPIADASEIATTPVFSWESSPGAESYSLIVALKSDFSGVVITEDDIVFTSHSLSKALADGYSYYWKVVAKNKSGETVAENAGLIFRTKAIPPSPSPTISKYYVSPDGEDNPDRGGIDNPFRTLAYAASRVPSGEGDTLFLKAGTFFETDPAVIPVGVNVIGSGETLTTLSSTGVKLATGIDASSSNYKLWYDGALIQLTSPHRTSFRNINSAVVAPTEGNQTISGFTIDGNNKSLKAGLWVENRSSVTLHHVTFKNLAQRGAVFGPGAKNFYVYPDFYMTGIKIHDCRFVNSGKDLSDETLGNLCIAQLDGADIYNITINDNEGYGIKFIYDGYFKNTRIHDCEITLNESDNKWGEDIAIELWNLGPGNKIYNINCNTWLSIVNHPEMFGAPVGTENMKVYNVKMIDKDGTSGKEAIEIGAPGVEVYSSYFENKGFGMAIWDMGRKNITIRNNVFYNSTEKDNWTSGAAIYIDNSRTWEFKNIRIYNNVFDTHKVAIKTKFTGAGISDIEIKNNAFLNSSTAEVQAMGSNITFFNNLKFRTGSSSWSITGITTEANNIIGSPLFSNSGDRWNTFYKPSSNASLVIDKGVDVGLSFSGSAPDIGAFEYQ